MARQIEPGQELSQEDYDWLKDRMRVEEAINIWGCTLAEGVGDEEDPLSEEPIVAPNLEALQTGESEPAPPPGAQLAVHPEQIGFIAGTEDAVVGDDEDDVPPYDEWKKADLEAEAERRGLEVEGSGNNGAVVKADLVAALEADDEE